MLSASILVALSVAACGSATPSAAPTTDVAGESVPERVGIEALERFQPGDAPGAEVVLRTVDERTVEVEFNTGPICSSDLLSIEPVSVVASYDAETVQITIDPTLTCDGDAAEFRSGVRLTLDEVIADREVRVSVDRRG
jgi:hypothetical protein